MSLQDSVQLLRSKALNYLLRQVDKAPSLLPDRPLSLSQYTKLGGKVGESTVHEGYGDGKKLQP